MYSSYPTEYKETFFCFAHFLAYWSLLYYADSQFVILRVVWIRNQSAAVASGLATNLDTHFKKNSCTTILLPRTGHACH